jgi:hypothetical protein
MLTRCFKGHTEPLLLELEPHVVILSGGDAHKFKQKVKDAIRGVKVIEKTLHYAHRKGKKAELAELERVRAVIETIRKGQTTDESG